MLVTSNTDRLMPAGIPFELQILAFWNGIMLVLQSLIPGFFLPRMFLDNVGLNMLPSDSFMSNLFPQLRSSTDEFQHLQLIAFAVFGAVD